MPRVQDVLFNTPTPTPIPTSTSPRSGKPWYQQKLSEPPIDILRRVRRAMYDGNFNLNETDHNHPQYVPGLSNKQIIILGAKLLGWDIKAPKGEPDYQLCFEAVMEAAVGTRP